MILRLLTLMLVLFCGFAPAGVTTTALSRPRADREFRGVWVATVANIDWPSTNSLSPDQQKQELLAVFDQCVELNLNAVVLQVRPACDALYKSDLEPWSDFLTGEAGRPPRPFYDPLEFAVEEAHNRGLELHAWFNPYRAHHPQSNSPIPDSHVSKVKPELVKKVGDYLWLDPAEQGTQDHSYDVMLDVVRRYDIDGVHMDDYFYPYKAYAGKDEQGRWIDFPDEPAWQRYQAAGGTLARDDWRRDNVNRFVERLYAGIKKEKPWVKFGISPFGIWRPGHPPGVSGMDQYSELYADAKKWLNEAWVDYFTPQIYWTLASTGQSYVKLTSWWVSENAYSRHIWVGNGMHRIADDSSSPWPAREIVDQIRATRGVSGASGNIHFSMKVLGANRGGICDLLTSEVYRRPALVPASPWLDEDPPETPTIELTGSAADEDTQTVSWTAGGDPEDVRLWVLYMRFPTRWTYEILPKAMTRRDLSDLARNNELADSIALTAVDRCGNESDPAMIYLSKSAGISLEQPRN